MTEYNASSPPVSDSQRFSQVHVAIAEAAHLRRALQSSIEKFEASLDAEHEVALRLAPFGPQCDIHLREIRFSPSSVVVFHGYGANGEPVELVQHLSQVNCLLTAARKRQDTPLRVAFLHGAL